METCPDEEFKAYRRVIGGIMGDIYLNVKQPFINGTLIWNRRKWNASEPAIG
jgi:hypothetical protein